MSTGESHQMVSKPKSDPTYGMKPKTFQNLKDDLTEIRKYRNDVLALVSDIWRELPPT